MNWPRSIVQQQPEPVAGRTHYSVLGVSSSADDATIRTAYRRLARDHHPDRAQHSSAAGGIDMPAINEAYRVLKDSGRRTIYDRSLRRSATISGSSTTAPDAPPGHSAAATEPEERWDFGRPDPMRPARVPWRSLSVVAAVGIVGVLVLAQFSGIDDEVGPDGILRNGDCVELQANGDAREVSCTGEGDLVVRAFIPFDGTCPGLSEPHRDRQGMGVACINMPD